MNATFCLIFIFALIAILVDRFYVRAKSARAFRARFDRQFLEAKLELSDPLYQFDGASATVIATVEEMGKRGNAGFLLSIERYARNQHGEYFLVRSDEPGAPFVKHVSHRIAKVILAEKYIESNTASSRT
ncbi:hypothetical protein SAMN05428948_1483 [Massilia sp. CF038]|nr:hypothetical protein SAMN05428948_1483 [Massilia sp. CF038]